MTKLKLDNADSLAYLDSHCLARLLHITKKEANRIFDYNEFPYVTIGNKRIVDRETIDDWFSQKRELFGDSNQASKLIEEAKSFPKKAGVYSISNGVRHYIGQTTDLQSRVTNHVSMLINGKHSIEDMQNDFNRNPNGFTIKILEMCKVKDLYRTEKKYIEEYGAYKMGYNKNPGTDVDRKEHNEKIGDVYVSVRNGYGKKPYYRARFNLNGKQREYGGYNKEEIIQKAQNEIDSFNKGENQN